jgi:hypothetical protein
MPLRAPPRKLYPRQLPRNPPITSSPTPSPQSDVLSRACVRRLVAKQSRLGFESISTAIVQGTRIIITAIWSIDKSEFDARIQANSTTLADLNSRMAAATKNSVCSMDVMAAFVRLGGQVQYAYRTLDHPGRPEGAFATPEILQRLTKNARS